MTSALPTGLLRTVAALALLAGGLGLAAQARGQAHTPARGSVQAQAQTPHMAQAAVPSLQALTLAQAWQVALEHDPSYQAAISEREAGQTERAMGRAGLLPQVSASSSRNRVRGTLDVPGPGGETVRQDLRYTSKVDEIRGSQLLFDWSRFAEYRRGNARADYSLAVFDTQENETAYRLINRYFQALLAFENVALTESRVDANAKQLKAAERRFDAGEGTITETREAKSRLDLARADLVLARDDLVLAAHELQEMVGRTPLRLFRLKDDFRPGSLQPATLDGWMALAMSANPQIRSSVEAVRVSQTEVHRTFGGHLPTVEVIAARRKVAGESVTTRDQRSLTTSVGIQARLPIFSGGRTHAQVQQARHNRDRSEFELQATQDEVMVDVMRQYQGVVSGAERIAALEQAVESSDQALTAVQRGFDAGTRTLVDVLDAQELLYQARMDLIQARLEYIVARLMLAGAADVLDVPLLMDTTREFFGDQYMDVG